jgi:transcriptional regulator
MYIPKLFKNENVNEVKDFIVNNSFGILINQTDGRISGTHIPMYLDTNKEGKDILHGHISKANPQWKNFHTDNEVLVIFSGPHSYISSSWYDHDNVPTWNYIAVHIYGSIKIIEGDQLVNSLKKLVDKYEAKSVNPVSVDTMSDKVLSENLRGIIGFEIEIKEIQCAKKLSQNRDDINHQNIVSELNKTKDLNSELIAQEMKKNRAKLS